MVKYGWRNVEIVDGKYLEDLKHKAKAFNEVENIFNNYFERYGCYPSPKEYVQEVVSVIDNYKERADDER